MSGDNKILILASTRKDSEATQKLLSGARLNPFVCESFDHLFRETKDGCGVLLLAKEVLISPNLERLSQEIRAQESWSDLPIIILASTGDITQGKVQTAQMLKALRNTTILERPVRVATLVSVLESALVDRNRQYEVRNLLHALEKAKEESDRANKAKSEFLANMSHEIRTPLGAVIGFSELALASDATDEEKLFYTNVIRRNGQQLLALINDVLDLSKVEAGKIALEEVDVSIEVIFEEVMSVLRPLAEKKQVSLNIEYLNEIPPLVQTDPTRLKQIVTNVLGNAVKFTQKGNIDLKIAMQAVGSESWVMTAEITDSGLGMSTEQQSKLFQPFMQADSSTTRAYGGTGLGLMLSRQLARALGGDLQLVKSEPDKGSKFLISVKVNKHIESLLTDDLSRSIWRPLPRQLSGLKILVVEDSADNQLLISRVLQSYGISVEIAGDGLEGIEKAHQKKYDVVLMDIQMPRLDGYEATQRLRREGYLKPIVGLTAHALKGDRERAIQDGFDDYLTKPLQRTDLVRSLSRFVKEP